MSENIPAADAAAMPDYPSVLGLRRRPFGKPSREYLFEQCRPVQEALEELVHKCWYSDELIHAELAVPRVREDFLRLFQRRLGDDFLVFTLHADLMMGPQALLRGFCEALEGPTAAPRGAADPDSLLLEVEECIAQAYGNAREVVIQIENAHELSAEALAALLPLMERSDERVAPHVVLWGADELWERLEYIFGDRDVSLGRIYVPAFTEDEVRDYLRHCLERAGHEGPLPFSERQLIRLYRQSGAVPAEIDRLAEAELVRLASKAATRWRLPLRHVMAGGVLAALLVWLYGTAPEPAPPAVAVPMPAAASPDPGPQAATSEPAAPPEPAPILEAEGEPAADVSGASATTDTEAVQSATLTPASAGAAEDDRPLLARHRDSLLAMPPEHYVIQLMGSFSQDRALDFMGDRAGAGRFYHFLTSHQDRPWYVVVHGDFPSRAAAGEALAGLPRELRRAAPWIRSMGEIRGLVAAGGPR